MTSLSNTKKPVLLPWVDVVVLGGGFAGLSAALNVQAAGLSCVVLEAQDRLGGKSFTKKLQNGAGSVEMGCTWTNNTSQKRIWALIQKFGLETKQQYVTGKEVFQDIHGKVHLSDFGQLSPTLPAEDAAVYQKVVALIEEESQKLSPATPGRPLPGVKLGYEDTTVHDWLVSQGANGFSYFCVTHVCTGIFGVEPRNLGLYQFLEMVRSCGSFTSIGSDLYDGGHYLKVRTGTSSIIVALAGSLRPDSVSVSSPVAQIFQKENLCAVTTTTGRTVICSRVIMTIPSNKSHKIAFQPPLPEAKRAYIAQCKDNTYFKCIVTYRSAWWKDLGFVGKFNSMTGPINYTWEISDDQTNQYSLAVFLVADFGERFMKLNRVQRERAILENLTSMVGKPNRALVFNILEYNEQSWGESEWIGGACYPALGAGGYKSLSIISEPFGNIHFGGTETGTVWRGFMEGAVESGERTSAEVVAAICGRNSTSRL